MVVTALIDQGFGRGGRLRAWRADRLDAVAVGLAFHQFVTP